MIPTIEVGDARPDETCQLCQYDMPLAPDRFHVYITQVTLSQMQFRLCVGHLDALVKQLHRRLDKLSKS